MLALVIISGRLGGLLEIVQMNHVSWLVLKPTHSLWVYLSVCVSVCVFCDNAIMGSVSGTEAAVDNTQASCSCCLSVSKLAGGWLNAIKMLKWVCVLSVFAVCFLELGRAETINTRCFSYVFTSSFVSVNVTGIFYYSRTFWRNDSINGESNLQPQR